MTPFSTNEIFEGKNPGILVAMNKSTPEDNNDWNLIQQALMDYDYDVFMTASGFTAIQEMRSNYPLVILQIDLQGIGGLEMMQTAKSIDPNTQVIILSPDHLLKEVVESLRLGAYDYILKPITDVAEIMNKVNNAWSTRDLTIMNERLIGDLRVKNDQLRQAKEEIEQWNEELEHRVVERTIELEQLFRSTIRAITRAMEAKDPYTHGHSSRVCSYAVTIAKEYGLKPDEIAKLTVAAELHDIGKIAIKDRILTYPGRLSAEDLAIMRTHPERGAEIVEPIKMLNYALAGIRWHHEWWDGTGYPDGLRGEEIPIHARIIGVADTFDAMTSTRNYQRKMDPDWVVDKIRGWSGNRYDPEVVDAFLSAYHSGRLKIIEADESLLDLEQGSDIPVVGPPPKVLNTAARQRTIG